ncbi:hypothetical protein [Anaerosacchariphilus polymeriproducens]|uniref:Uncharacterized protein n=1 Tax=Anaerosacchariphilus polymeriproducens TaxID=1812858 RepID=A0A371AUK4_9FIRM|nr:hypothetical protein [Anaerosacchariphilus polymeriproducens]RDU23222.1 hypothetical protein DWV06_10605 [Anaerosacchariphilus polymeriproducens]
MSKIDKKVKKELAWEYGYMLAMTAISCILAYLLNKLILPAIFIILLAVLVGIVVLWTKPISRKLLYLHNILNSLASVSFAYLLVTVFIKSVDSFITVVIIIVVMDLFSFTKAGKKTPNAKLINNNNTLARLSICLPVPGKPGLQPIIGVGDLYFYSAMSVFSLHIFGVNVFGNIFCLILVGQLINILLISIIKNKIWYKGFPATLFPGIFYLIIMYIV